MSYISAFIGSSSEGQEVALAIQQCLDKNVESEVWTQGAFLLMKDYLDSLMDFGAKYDIAIIVLTGDEIVSSRNVEGVAPRDNVIMEIGFFMGTLGRNRTFIVCEEGTNLLLPSYLNGISLATFKKPTNGNLLSAVSRACMMINKSLRHLRPKHQNFIESGLKVTCQTLGIPELINLIDIRAFVFKKEGDQLVCRYNWSANPQKEIAGALRFDINDETKSQVIVVRSYMERAVVGCEVSVIPEDFDGMEGEVQDNLCYILAAPIIGPDKNVWGIVDFDTSTSTGMEVLKSEYVKPVLFNLGKYLYMSLNRA